jgi:hypothetical protein
MGRMDPTPHVGMFNRVNNLEKAIVTNCKKKKKKLD